MDRFARLSRLASTVAVAIWVNGALIAAAAAEDDLGYDPRKVSVDELEIVDCILPGQVRMLGRMTYQTPRRLVRAKRIDCSIRGGEAKLYDRTDTKSALEAWLPAAEQNDFEAQNRVALIYEGAFGGAPDFARAASWYRRAAEGGHKPAMFSLATLLEQGKGVEKNVLEALEWYRRASGIEGDRLRLSSDAQRELDAVRNELQAKLEESQGQIDALDSQVAALKQQASTAGANAQQAQAQVDSLSKLVDQLKKDQETRKVQLAAIPQFRTPKNVDAPLLNGPQLPVANQGPSPQRLDLGDVQVGKYYALIIGNQSYQNLDPLSSPRRDAEVVADLLEQRYGFEVMLLLDADAATLKRAVNEIDARAGENDNVLIYFAGHGVIRNLPGEAETNRETQGFWLPVEAEVERDTFWIDNMWVTEHLALNKAKRVLVVADSCYAGLFSSDPSVLLTDDSNLTKEEIEELAALRSRFVLSSGDVKPVLDRGKGEHSVFAQAFIDVLSGNGDVMSSVGLYRQVFEKVAIAARELGMEQLPQLRPIRPAGHEWGEFFFVPRD